MLLAALWAFGAIAGYVYATQQNIPVATALRVMPAYLLEVTFFYVLGSDELRLRVEKWPPASISAALTVAAVLPYSEATLALGSFHLRPFLIILGAAALVSIWYVILPQQPAVDILLLAIVGGVWISGILQKQYPNPVPKLQLPVLAQLMWFRTGVFAMVAIRKSRDVGFGLWPDGRQWRIGALYYALFLPVATLVAWWIGFARPRFPAQWEKATIVGIATFFGVLWVLALGEEFFFRGLLQQWMTKWLRSEVAGLLVTSVLFGSVHLWFHSFPNWRFALLAALAGVFYGLAFQKARSIRASMVAHALVVTTWRVFFP